MTAPTPITPDLRAAAERRRTTGYHRGANNYTAAFWDALDLATWAAAELDRRKECVLVKREVLEEIINAFGDYGLGAWNYAACQLFVSKLVVALSEAQP